MKKVLSIVLCAMVLVAMLSSSAFAVVKSVHLDSTQTIAESGLVYGSWKIITASSDKTSARVVHVLPKYKKGGFWINGAKSEIKLSRGTSIGDTEKKTQRRTLLEACTQSGWSESLWMHSRGYDKTVAVGNAVIF